MGNAKTIIVTGASQGIGAEVVKAFMERGYNIVATSRKISSAGIFKNSTQLQLVDGDVGRAQRPLDESPAWHWIASEASMRLQTLRES